MNTFSPFLSVETSCESALQWAKAQLSGTGLRIVQTFDLQMARHGLHDCSCPNHGTEACDCQMVVLLVYGEAIEPATVVLHGNNGRTWVSIADNSQHRINAKLARTIQQALGQNM
jgi:hypothetical protein